MLETDMYKELVKLFTVPVKRGFLRRVETGLTVGFPDTTYTYGDTVGWIELKQTKKSNNEIVVPYRPGQQGFLMENKIYGGMVFVLLYIHYANGKGMYYLINKNFNLKRFKNECELLKNCCWRGRKLDVKFLSKLRRH